MDIDTLRKTFSGDIILPDDEAYEKVRSSFMETGSPVVVVLPRSTDDVAAAIKFGRDNSLIISVRSGGHSNAGLSTNVGGLVIDLSHLNKVELIDTKKHTVRIGTGARWGNVATTLQKYGLALSSGDTKTVGVGGLTLGGGIGWMVRKYGLAIDNLVAADVVTSDGKVLRTSKTKNPDLFWAIRGGGGNFGIVTSFEFTTQQVGDVYAGVITYSLDNLADLLKGWRDHMRTAPEELNTTLVVMPPFGDAMPAGVMLIICYADDDEPSAMAAIEPLKKIGVVTSDTVSLTPYPKVLEEAHPPAGMNIIVKNGFVKDFSDKLIQLIAEAGGKPGAPALQIRSLGGAINRVASDATAFAHRDSEALMVAAHFIPLDALESAATDALKPWNMMSPFTSGSYINLLSDATDDEVAASYPKSTYERLVTIKNTYDPENVFNQNYNIKPVK